MVEEDLGEATLVYEGPDGETEEWTIDNEHVAYFQDHWIVRTDDADDDEPDTIRRIPASRVYHVERDVEEFEEEVATVFDDVQSVADGLQQELRTLPERLESVVGDVPAELFGARREGRAERRESEEPIEIDVGEDGAQGSTAGDEEVPDEGGEEQTS